MHIVQKVTLYDVLRIWEEYIRNDVYLQEACEVLNCTAIRYGSVCLWNRHWKGSGADELFCGFSGSIFMPTCLFSMVAQPVQSTCDSPGLIKWWKCVLWGMRTKTDVSCILLCDYPQWVLIKCVICMCILF